MSKLRDSVRDWDCTVRINGACNFNPETTVLAHLNGAGMGMKKHDIFGAATCSNCHDILGFRVPSVYAKETLKLWRLEVVIRTQEVCV